VTADDLTGMALPKISLPSTGGGFVDPSAFEGLAALIIHPYTGKPGVPDPPGWDHIAGAHGSTSQLLAYRALRAEFEKRGVTICAISLLSPDWQQDFVHRTSLSFDLLSDAGWKFTSALQLETFAAGDRSFLRRRTLMVKNGGVILDRRNVDPPDGDATAVLKWLVDA
jgi:peroxiredoxin